MYQKSNLHHMKVSPRMMKMSYSLVIAKMNLMAILQAVVQDYQTKRLNFKNLSLSSIGQLRFLKYFMFDWFDLSMRIKKKKKKKNFEWQRFHGFLILFEFLRKLFPHFFSFFFLKDRPRIFFFGFNPSVFVGITGLILNLKMRFQPN